MNKRFVLRLIRNCIIAGVSAVWILPLFASIHALLHFFWLLEADRGNGQYPLPPFSMVVLSQWFLVIAEILLLVALFFWGFIAANKLWPIKRKQDVNE
jgi:hypothetical protein